MSNEMFEILLHQMEMQVEFYPPKNEDLNKWFESTLCNEINQLKSSRKRLPLTKEQRQKVREFTFEKLGK